MISAPRMHCLDANQVMDLLGRRLPPAERDTAERHLDECSDCQALLSALGRTLMGEMTPAAPVDDPPRIGRYHLQERLGAGGMGVVYAAHDPELERRVAVKLVRPELASAGGLARLLREARALARLSHPNVVPVHDAGIDGEKLFVAMELVAGATLDAWLRDERRSWRQVVAMFSAAGRGLAAAHQAGLVHRDFKPENVLLGSDGRPRVSDFGLAIAGLSEPVEPAESATGDRGRSQALGSGVEIRLTRTGAVLGTPAYMAPEQYGGRADARSDQFSFCASLFEALYGERPFVAHSLEEMAAAVSAGAVRTPSEPRRAPGWLRRAVLRGLSPDPAARFPSMEALLAAIDPRPRARRARAIAATAVLATAAAAIAFAATRDDAAAEPPECRAAAAARAAMWTGADRAAIERALLATGRPYAATTWQRVEKGIDGFVASLASAEASICAQVPRTTEARGEFDLGIECLADRRANLARVLTELRQVDAGSIHKAVVLVHDIQTPAHCADLSELRGLRHVLARPGGAAALAEVRRKLAVDAREQRARGSYAEALATARRAAEQARQLDAGPMVVRALLAAGEYAILAEGDPSAEKIYREAAALAETVGFDDARATAMVRLMAMIGRQAGREEEGLAMEPLVAAAIERSSEATSLRSMLHQAIGYTRFQLGQYQKSLEELQTALEQARTALPPDDPRMPDYLYPVGVVLARLGRAQESADIQTEAVDAARAIYGEDHPDVAIYLSKLATAQGELGRCDLALDNQRRARAVLAQTIPLESIDYINLLRDMGVCLVREEKLDDALREFREIIAILERAGRPKDAEVAFALSAIGDVYIQQDNLREATRSHRRAVDLIEDGLGRHDVRLAYPLTRLADLELAAGHPRAALPLAERALSVLVAQKVDEVATGDARFAVARALWDGGHRARAREQAERALAAFESAGSAYGDRATGVKTWLAEAR